jgi:N-methylhydantoinase B
VVKTAGHWNEDVPNAKVHGARLLPGDAFEIRSGGGGGYGPPEERDARAIADDIRQGYITRSAAERDYHVVVDERSGTVDRAVRA